MRALKIILILYVIAVFSALSYTLYYNNKGDANENASVSQEGIKATTANTIISQKQDMGYKSVSAYTLGRVEETDNTPCHGAWGDDLCTLKALGVNICASNDYVRGDKLELILDVGHDDNLQPIYACYVLDRMNERYVHGEIDIAMLDQGAAIDFGRQWLKVIKVDEYVRQ